MTIPAVTQALPVQNQNLPHKKRVNYVQITGYGATALAAGSAIAASKKNIPLHKYLAYAAGVLTAAHIGIVEYFHHKKAK